jgi:uncharacterized protein (DUF2235 family)
MNDSGLSNAISKNIVICADGTGNSFDTNVSNVVRLVRCLDLDSSTTQIVFYDQGVGTRQASVNAAFAFKNGARRPGLVILDEPTNVPWLARPIARLAGLGFGYGLKANIHQLYVALASEYKTDESTPVFLFGFSRGAFTVRALAALVHRCGLLPPERLSLFSRAYTEFFEERHRERMAPAAREAFDARLDKFRDDTGARKCRIRFLGIWDTVKSYGFIYPKSLPHLRHNPDVGTVRHAVALHERRSYYQLTSWGGVDHPLYEDTHPGDSSDVKEVWFAGSHSDVGGGFPRWRNGLARAPFEWMVRQAQGYGLHVSGAGLDGVWKEFGTELALNESLRRGWWIAELLPRFELENIPFPGQRVLKWGSTGARDPLSVRRGNCVSVHATTLDWHQAADVPFIPAEHVRIERE